MNIPAPFNRRGAWPCAPTRTRTAMFLLFAAVIIITTRIVIAQDTPDSDNRVPVIIVTQPIPRGTIFIPQMLYGDNPVVEVQQWDATFAPQTAITTLAEIEGKVARLDLTTRMPLLEGNLTVDTLQTADIGSDASLLIPPNKLGVPLRNISASPESDELDCVNVIGIFDFGGELSASPIPLGFEGVIVERKPDSDIITVALSPEEALTVTWVQDNDIPLRLDSCAN